MNHKIKRYGWIHDLPDHRDHLYAAPPMVLQQLPPLIDLRNQFTPVYDQGDLGSCTGNAIAAAIEFERIKQQLPDFIPSRLFIYYNERVIEGTTASDSGAQIRDGIKSVAAQGVCSEAEWPYDVSQFAIAPPDQCYHDALMDKVVLYSSVNQALDQMKGCLASGYPFVFGFTVYNSFESDSVAQTGIAQMPESGEQVIGGHAVVAVGYDDTQQRFIVRNSWGANWGMQGYFTLPYSYLTDADLADDFWTIRLVTAPTQQSLGLHQQLRDSIKDEISKRTKIHQNSIARLKANRTKPAAAGGPASSAPLVLLAHGDSWFDYPLSGNSLSLSSTDIIAQLGSMGTVQPVILNISHYGDATTDEMSLPKQQRLIESLQNPANWMDKGKPDAILFSGGGNDIAGDHFCIFLDYAAPGATGLDASRFQKVLGMIEASYLDLFSFRDRYAPGVPIFGHCYDFPIPNGVHPVCAGPWLKPSLDYCGWDVTQGTGIVKQALIGFKNLLSGFANNPNNNFILVNTQGVLSPSDWANELHPYPDGFKKIAQKFSLELQLKFP